MKTVKRAALCALSVMVLCLSRTATAQTKQVSLWNGELVLTVPATAGSAKKLSSKLYSIQPTAKKQKIVLYASREPVLRDEKAQSDAQLASSIKTVLEAQGYAVEGLRGKNGVFSARISGSLLMPWRKVGTASVRGMAKFKRTAGGQLVGALVLTDPAEWSQKPARRYRLAVTRISVAK